MNLVRLPYSMANKKAPAKGNKRSVTKKQHTPDYYPVQRKIALGADGSTLTGNRLVDAGKLLSVQNRRLYRQGMKYELKIDLDVDITAVPNVQVEVFALADNWDTQRAWALAKATYDRAYADEQNNTAAQLARWRDFRVQSGVTGIVELDPVVYNDSLAFGVLNAGEHAFSSVDVGGTETFFGWGAASASRLDILDEWIRAGSVGSDPSTGPTTAPYDGVNSDNMSNIEMQNLSTDGNLPPYATTADGENWLKVCSLQMLKATGTGEGLQRLSTGYFSAPCGLVALRITGSNLPNGSILMTAKAGDYKGVMAHRMAQE